MDLQGLRSAKTWAIIIIIVLIVLAVYSMIASHITPSTNDAVLKSYTAMISPQVSGKIVAVDVKNNQQVKAGQVLFKIDARPYQLKVQAAQAALSKAQMQVDNLRNKVKEAQHQLKQKQANFSLAKKDYASKQHDLNERRQYIDAKQAVDDAKLALTSAKTQLGKQNGNDNPALLSAQSEVDKAKLNLQYTTVKAPSDGTITNLHTTIGNYASIGKIQMALVLAKHWFVFANIKENNLGNVKPGDQAKIILNSYPQYTFSGHVVSISNGVAHAPGIPDNYLPYVEKTHDWVRLAQRFPVQIKLDSNPRLKGVTFRSGMSVMALIYTRQHSVWNGLAYLKLGWHKLFTHVS